MHIYTANCGGVPGAVSPISECVAGASQPQALNEAAPRTRFWVRCHATEELSGTVGHTCSFVRSRNQMAEQRVSVAARVSWKLLSPTVLGPQSIDISASKNLVQLPLKYGLQCYELVQCNTGRRGEIPHGVCW